MTSLTGSGKNLHLKEDPSPQRKTVSELLPYYYYNLRTLAEVVSSQSQGRCRVFAWGKCCGGGSGGEVGGWVEKEGGRVAISQL